MVRFDADKALVPEEAIFAAAELLAHLIARFDRDGGVTAYNSGVTRGAMVKRLGFARARKRRALFRHGTTHLQGHRFLPRVLAETNRLRSRAGLLPLAV